MTASEIASIVAILIGHASIWVTVLNQVHATAIPRWLLGTIHLFGHTMLTLAPLAALVYSGGDLRYWTNVAALPLPLAFYILCTMAFAVLAVGIWVYRRFGSRSARAVPVRSRRVDLQADSSESLWGSGRRRAFSMIPRNELFEVEINEKEIPIPRLPPELDGVAIAHLSDFHFVGTVRRAFFEHIVDLTNEWDADYAAITGDILDTAACLDWIEPTLGKLRPRHRSFFVLGNHDLRMGDVPRLRRAMDEAGLVDLGGRVIRDECCRQPIDFGGNELPWHLPAADFHVHESNHRDETRPLRIALAHSPDQLAWARRFHVDLMLAGHTHGGQIRIPGFGPVFTPSRFGTKYASNVFVEPPTTMHVSRGISALTPLRINCAPEMTRVVLRAVPDSAPASSRRNASAREPAAIEKTGGVEVSH